MNKAEYKDLIAFHPGYYIKDIIAEMDITQSEFAKRLGTTDKTLSKLLSAQIPLSKDIAQKLSQMLGTTIELWLKLQLAYDEKVIEIEQRKSIDEEKEYLKLIDYNYFVDLKLVKETQKPEERIFNLRKFLQISSLSVLKEKDFLVACRSVLRNVTEKNIINANAWVQTALNSAKNLECDPYNKKLLISYLPQIRKMTLQKPEIFYPRLGEIFRECGVAFVRLPHLPSSGVHGAVKWINESKVLLAINNGNQYADTFWFSLLHEIKHILQQKIKSIFISGDKDYKGDSILESEADLFARNYLISEKEYQAFIEKGSFDITSIKNFAQQIDLHPDIVIGRLQIDKYLESDSFEHERITYFIK
ncbi:MAG: HigA family addiction module antidote protein [Sporomusaceae bacterium]|jgi:addiction module HigA family antidote|nr:HigA family addiction module antidote protein [Sporomusaceae bacterium]